MVSLAHVSKCTALLAVTADDLAKVMQSLCEDAGVYEFRINTFAENGTTKFYIDFDHSPSSDFDNSKSYQLTELRRRGVLKD